MPVEGNLICVAVCCRTSAHMCSRMELMITTLWPRERKREKKNRIRRALGSKGRGRGASTGRAASQAHRSL